MTRKFSRKGVIITFVLSGLAGTFVGLMSEGLLEAFLLIAILLAGAAIGVIIAAARLLP